VRSSRYRASGPATYSRIVLALRMSNDMNSGRHVDVDVAAWRWSFGFGGVLSHLVQLRFPAGEGGLAVR
jgi:hypothetical protein